jgi:hypothetical protein
VFPVNPEPNQVAEVIRELSLKSAATLSAYWLAVTGDRNDYAAQLSPLLAAEGMPVLIVRNQRFDHPQSLTRDIVQLLKENRQAFLAALGRDQDRINIVLLARTELAMGQSSSPVIWPAWVPKVGRKQVPCFITDVTRKIDIPFAGIDASRINRALYAVESALVRRLAQVSVRAPEKQVGFFTAIMRRGDVSWLDFLAKAKTGLQKVTDTTSYRPDVKLGRSVVSRLWAIAQSGTAEDVESAARALTSALEISAETPLEAWREGFFGALARGHRPDEPQAQRFSRSVIVTVSAACRYITCGHHTDEYPSFPVNLLMSVVDDLYRSLTGIETCLIHLEDQSGLLRLTHMISGNWAGG